MVAVKKEPFMATSIKIDDELKGRVQHLAGARQRSAHWIMHEAIKQYVEREEARESFKQEALASWKTYQETGRHLAGQEVRTWLNTWGTDGETELPECHE
jgi:predicted transcriptional regulator